MTLKNGRGDKWAHNNEVMYKYMDTTDMYILPFDTTLFLTQSIMV